MIIHEIYLETFFIKKKIVIVVPYDINYIFLFENLILVLLFWIFSEYFRNDISQTVLYTYSHILQ